MKWLLLLVIPFLFMYNKKRKKKKKQSDQQEKFEKDKEDKRKLLGRLEVLIVEETEGYSGEMKEKLIQQNQRVEAYYNELLEHWEEVLKEEEIEGVKQIETEVYEQREEQKTATEAWRKLENQSELVLKEGKELLDKSSFYPIQLVFHLNKLSGMIMDKREERRKNPFEDSIDLVNSLKETREELNCFVELHKQAIELINNVDAYKEKFSDEEQKKVLLCKQQLYTQLQNSFYKEARQNINFIQKIVKKHA